MKIIWLFTESAEKPAYSRHVYASGDAFFSININLWTEFYYFDNATYNFFMAAKTKNGLLNLKASFIFCHPLDMNCRKVNLFAIAKSPHQSPNSFSQLNLFSRPFFSPTSNDSCVKPQKPTKPPVIFSHWAKQSTPTDDS